MAHPHDHDHAHDHGHGHDHGHYHPEPEGGPPRFSDPGQEALSQALRSGFMVLRVIMVILVIAYFMSGLFRLNPGDQGLLVRLGALRENPKPDPAIMPDSTVPSRYVFGPGLHFSLPRPFEQQIRLEGTVYTVEIDTFCFQRKPEVVNKPLSETVPQYERLSAEQGTMLSGDRNLSHGVWTVEYHVSNGEQFVRNIGEKPGSSVPGQSTIGRTLITRLGEEAITRTIAGVKVDRLLRRDTAGDVDIAVEVQRQLNKSLADLHTGLIVNKVTLESIEPGMVRQAFLAVTTAENAKAQAINEAQQQRASILGETAGAETKVQALLGAIDAFGAAQMAGETDETKLAALRGVVDGKLDDAEGEVARRLSEARTVASAMAQQIAREYEQFSNYRDQYRQNRMLFAVQLWVKMRSAVLDSLQNEMFFVPRNANTIEIITNRDEERMIRATDEAIRKKQMGG